MMQDEIQTLRPDALSPAEIAEKAEKVGEAKAAMPKAKCFASAMLAGAFIAFGALYFCVFLGDPSMQMCIRDSRMVTALFDAGDLSGLLEIDETFGEEAAECGLRSFRIMAGALEGLPISHELLSYEGPFGVGYAVAAFEVQGSAGDGAVRTAVDRDEDRSGARDAAANDAPVDPYVALARASVEGFVRTGNPIAVPDGLPPELSDKRAGVFVSLHEHGELRGCIGTISPVTGSTAAEIVRNGVAAASEDPRFPPVRPDELDALSYSVDVLFTPMPVESIDQLDPARYGVIVTKGWKRGLLLPNLDGVDSAQQQVDIAKRKAGIDLFDDDVELERFEVVRHERGGEPRRG